MPKAFVITNPMIAANKSAEVTLSKFLRVISVAYDEVTIIGGNLSVEEDIRHVTLVSKPISRSRNKMKRLLDILLLQIWMVVKVLQCVRSDAHVYFWIGDKMVVPYIAAKMVHAEINYFIYGNVGKEGKVGRFQRISERLIQWMAEHADCVCMESPSVVDEWSQMKCKKVRIIHLYTEIREFAPVHLRKNVIGMLCRLTPGKHVLEAIEAMRMLHEQYPDWILEIVGTGKQEQECIAKIKNLSANAYIKMLGWQDHASLFSIIKNWKYLLFPTDTEGLPNCVIETMSMGIPSIASPAGGLKDLISEGINGYLLSGFGSTEIGCSVIHAISDISEKEYEQVSCAAYKTVKDEYSISGARNRFLHELKRT